MCNVCSPYTEDKELGSLPKWNDDVEKNTKEAGVTTHPKSVFIPKIVKAFKRKVC